MVKTKILLVRPPLSSKAIVQYPPVGFLSFIPYFQGDIEVHLCDLQADASLVQNLQWNPDLIALSCYSFTINETKETLNKITKLTKTKVIIGGPGVTADPEYASSVLNQADAFIVGDGETFAQKLQELNLEGIVKVPFFDMKHKRVPTWHMIDTKPYRKFPGFAVETSRGCPRGCFFCTAFLTAGTQYRPRPPIDVLTEIKFLRNRYHGRYFYFPDDNVALDANRFRELLRLIIEANLKSTFNVWEGIEAHHLDYDTLILMKQAGFASITLGAESGNQRVLNKVIGKGLDVDWTREVVKNARKVGLMVNCFFVIGIPGETLEEAKQTVAFAQELRNLGAYSCMVRNALPMRGTKMFNYANSHGYITVPIDNLRECSFVHSGKHFMETPEWKPEQIEELVSLAMKQDAVHILKHHYGRLIRLAITRSFTQPKRVKFRIKQLWGELRGRGNKDDFTRDVGKKHK